LRAAAGIASGYTARDGNADAAEANAAYFIPKTPLGRVGMPRDIAAVTSFALSEDASRLTACTIDAAGGMVSRLDVAPTPALAATGVESVKADPFTRGDRRSFRVL